MKKTQYERQNLAGQMSKPLVFADLISAGLGCLGFFFIVQPSSIAKTFGLTSLIAGGATAGITRLTHKRYIDIAYEHLTAQSDRSGEEMTRLNEEVHRLEGDVLNLSDELKENSDLLERQVQAQLHAEKHLTGVIGRLLAEKEGIEQNLAAATLNIKALAESQKTLLSRLKGTVRESLNYWSQRLTSLLASANKKNPDLESKLSKIAEDLANKVSYFEEELEAIKIKKDDIGDCIDELISLLHSIYDHFGLTRIQIVNCLHIRDKQNLIAKVELLSEETERLQAQDVVPRDQLQTLIDNYKARLEEFQASYSEHTAATLEIAQQLEQEVLGQDPVFEKMQFLLEQQI